MATSGGTARNTSGKIGLCVEPFLDGGTEGILRRLGAVGNQEEFCWPLSIIVEKRRGLE